MVKAMEYQFKAIMSLYSSKLCFDVHTTSITLKRRHMDVKTTSCSYWDVYVVIGSPSYKLYLASLKVRNISPSKEPGIENRSNSVQTIDPPCFGIPIISNPRYIRSFSYIDQKQYLKQ